VTGAVLSVRRTSDHLRVSDLTIALAGGAIGSIATVALTQAGRARAAWSDIPIHDDEARERNAQLVVWVDDRTHALVAEMDRRTEQANTRGALLGGGHGLSVAMAKADALHEYRDEEWRARLDLARLRTTEGAWHRVWRKLRGRHGPSLTARAEVEPFLERWREPVTRHGSANAVQVIDRTLRTTHDALAELSSLNLT
jgi:hypothetical protein